MVKTGKNLVTVRYYCELFVYLSSTYTKKTATSIYLTLDEEIKTKSSKQDIITEWEKPAISIHEVLEQGVQSKSEEPSNTKYKEKVKCLSYYT